MTDIKRHGPAQRAAGPDSAAPPDAARIATAWSLKRKYDNEDRYEDDGMARAASDAAAEVPAAPVQASDAEPLATEAAVDSTAPAGAETFTASALIGLPVVAGLGLLGINAAATGGSVQSGAAPVHPLQPRPDPVIVQPELPKPVTPEGPKAEIPKPNGPRQEITPPETSEQQPLGQEPTGQGTTLPQPQPETSEPVRPEPDDKPIDPTPRIDPTAPVPDRMPPAAAPRLALKNDTGADHTDRITSDSTITVSGLEQDATWRSSTDGGKTWHLRSDTELTNAMADGVHEVQVIQTDKSGKDSEAALLRFTLDTTAPVSLDVRLKNDDGFDPRDRVSSDGVLLLGGLENGANLTWYGSDASFHAAPGTPEFTIPGAAGVVNLGQLQQIDLAGNSSSLTAFNFLLSSDSNAPQLDSGRVRFGTTGADVFKVDEATVFFNYRRAEGDVIDLSSIAGTRANVSRSSGNGLSVKSEGGGWSNAVRIGFENFESNGPIQVKTADGKVFDV